ncbi:hypothetical protein [Actinoplanes sp. NPDC049265]|uniref:BP74-related protein n=1 Tax=Actinoplanes sp. NPDC049265 TaxID=3363902 RepID=UPI00371EF977
MKKRTAIPLMIAAALATTAVATGPTMAAAPTTAAGVIVTYRHPNNSTFKAILTDSTSIAKARAQLAGTEPAPSHPSGTINYNGANENTGWSWHLDNTRQRDSDIEACDGTPQDVENHAITVSTYCPWDAVVIAIQNN